MIRAALKRVLAQFDPVRDPEIFCRAWLHEINHGYATQRTSAWNLATDQEINDLPSADDIRILTDALSQRTSDDAAEELRQWHNSFDLPSAEVVVSPPDTLHQLADVLTDLAAESPPRIAGGLLVAARAMLAYAEAQA